MKPTSLLAMCMATAVISGCATDDVPGPADEAVTEPATTVHRVLFDAGHRLARPRRLVTVHPSSGSPAKTSDGTASPWRMDRAEDRAW